MLEPLAELEGREQSFEAIYQLLEETVEQLENGGLSLDGSISLYEAGMRLAYRCKTMLDAAELRISELEQEFSLDMASDEASDEAN